MNKIRTNQGGSVVSFVVVGVILVGLVAGGIYLLRQRNDNADKTPVATTSKAPTTSPSKSAAPSSPAATPAPTKSTQPASQPPASNQKAAAGTVTPPSTPSSPAVIPQTGPSDMIPSGIAFAALLGATVAFSQSVRARRHLFNQ
ncbi:MAG: hypothetical protein JWO07_805 [Candidatus Saccharibacteria bacterium]|nr:hypothetical protein [Candidatus Saccharibacteria bacterium]